LYFWRLFQSGRGALAARPGTSNHGLGVAVDVPTTRMAQLINQYGAEFGWQKRWSDAPSEWWHFKYAPQNDRHKGQAPSNAPKQKHPYHSLTATEKKWRNVLIRERRIAKRNGGWKKVGGDHQAMAVRAKKELRKQMKAIEDAAKKSGWRRLNRRVRYDYMRTLVNG
jgi:hypothetical protein